MFRYFLSDDSKQDAATTTVHSKFLIELFKKKVLTSTLSTMWENTDCCLDKYRCASALYPMSFFYQCHSIIIDRGISAPLHGKEVVGGLNSI